MTDIIKYTEMQKILKKILNKKRKLTTFKNDRGCASESKVCNEGCNEQSNEMMVTVEH